MTSLACLLHANHVLGKYTAIQHVDDATGMISVTLVMGDHDNGCAFAV